MQANKHMFTNSHRSMNERFHSWMMDIITKKKKKKHQKRKEKEVNLMCFSSLSLLASLVTAEDFPDLRNPQRLWSKDFHFPQWEKMLDGDFWQLQCVTLSDSVTVHKSSIVRIYKSYGRGMYSEILRIEDFGWPKSLGILAGPTICKPNMPI